MASKTNATVFCQRWWPRWLLLLAMMLGGVAVDQASKQWAAQHLTGQPSQSINLVRQGAFSAAFTFVRNPGAAWGLLSDADESFRRPFFIVVSIVAMALILFLYVRLEPGQRLVMFGLALVMAGALGNFIDRLRLDYVIDFIDLRLGSFRWPTFNAADAWISIGVALIFLDMGLAALQRPDGEPARQDGGTD